MQPWWAERLLKNIKMTDTDFWIAVYIHFILYNILGVKQSSGPLYTALHECTVWVKQKLLHNQPVESIEAITNNAMDSHACLMTEEYQKRCVESQNHPSTASEEGNGLKEYLSALWRAAPPAPTPRWRRGSWRWPGRSWLPSGGCAAGWWRRSWCSGWSCWRSSCPHCPGTV